MRPTLAVPDSTDLGPRDSKLSRDSLLAACGTSNQLHLVSRYLCACGVFTKFVGRWNGASFAISIVNVVSLSAKKQMRWVYTGAYITAMAYTGAVIPVDVWKFSISKPVSDAMGFKLIASTSADREQSVASATDLGFPEPTVVRSALVDLRPKSFFKSKLSVSHVTFSGSLVRGAAGADYTAAPRYCTTGIANRRIR